MKTGRMHIVRYCIFYPFLLNSKSRFDIVFLNNEILVISVFPSGQAEKLVYVVVLSKNAVPYVHSSRLHFSTRFASNAVS